MKHLNLKHFKQLLLSLMALACVTTAYAQDSNPSYEDFCKPTASTSGNKRHQTKGEILEQTNLAENSPLDFTPTGSTASQNWANTDNEILAYPGATFKLKVTYSDAWGSLTVFQLRSDQTPDSSHKIFGTYEGSWYSGVSGTNELYDNISKDTESGITCSETDCTITCPITIPSDINVGELVVLRFIMCKTADGATYDGTPCVTNATELNYCDYIVRIVEEEQAPVPCTLTKVIEPEEGGSVSVTVNGTEVNGTVNKGDVITVTYENNEGFIFESIEVTGATKVEETDNEYTVEDNVKVTVRFREETSSIGTVEVASVYYNAAEQVLYANSKVTVYDMTGCVVLVNEGNTSVAHLADGIYTAVVNGKAVKFNK